MRWTRRSKRRQASGSSTWPSRSMPLSCSSWTKGVTRRLPACLSHSRSTMGTRIASRSAPSSPGLESSRRTSRPGRGPMQRAAAVSEPPSDDHSEGVFRVSHEPEGGALRFDGDLVVVTGGSRGIGAAISKLFVSLGAQVISVSRTNPDASRPGISDLVADLSDDRTLDAIGARVEREWGIPSVLVNNAGINLRTSLIDPAAPIMQLEFMINAIAAARLTSVIGGLMRTAGGGSIVNVGSVKATLPGRSLGYGMSKAALENLTRSAAALLGPQGIRVNAVAPGDVVTDKAQPDDSRAYRNPLRRAVTPADVAWAVAFLSSVQAGSITGVILQIDAGYGIGLSTSSSSEGS